MADDSGSGPAWVGIGAQRSGTTWLTDLLIQHPKVGLGRSGVKEAHYLYRGILPFSAGFTHIGPLGPIDRLSQRLRRPRSAEHLEVRPYLDEFTGPGLRGEFTPAYLACTWAAPVAREVLRSNVPLLVVLRDPVERFASAMRLEAGRTSLRNRYVAARLLGSYAVWAGMYRDQLRAWADAVGRERLIVHQYERLQHDPQPFVDAVWRRLGLEPVPLTDVDRPSATSATKDWDWPPGLEHQLLTMYVGQYTDLERDWGVDVDLWRRP